MMQNFFLLLLFATMTVQNASSQKSFLKLANQYFEAGKYREAAIYYEKYNKTANQTSTLIKRGISHYYSNNPDACIRDMSLAKKLKTRDITIYKYAGLAYFVKMEYADAARFLKTYLNLLKKESSEWYETIEQIKRCEKGLKMQYETQLAFVENPGTSINSIYDDFGPVHSPTIPTRIYFSSNRENANGGLRNQNGLEDPIKGRYFADMYVSELEQGNWTPVTPFEPLLNSPKHDLLMGFNPDGSMMYFLRSSDLKTGIIYIDTFNQDDTNIKLLERAKIPVSGELGDKDLYIFSDSLIIFSGIRPEGYGGYDLYYTQKKDFIWSKPVNLGPDINSAYNEVSPFLTKSGNVLYFSSDRIEGMGGYDIYKTDYQVSDFRWTIPQNMAMPINSSKDDLDFNLSFDGMSALLSSDRLGGIGGKDIYTAYFKDQILDQLQYTDIPAFILNKDIEPEHDADITKVVDNSRTNNPIVKRDILIAPLYFRPNEDILTQNNLTAIKKLADIMIIYPELQVVLTGHSVEESKAEFDLYFSMKTAEKIADQLIRYGVKAPRIHLQSCGSQYPLAIPSINGIRSSLAEKINRRVDVDILNVNPEHLRVIYDNPVIASEFRDARWDFFDKQNAGITYRVLFAVTSQLYKGDIINTNSDIMMYKNASENVYYYTIGIINKFSEARILAISLSSANIPELTILPFYNNKRLEKNEMMELIKEYPELSFFLNEE